MGGLPHKSSDIPALHMGRDFHPPSSTSRPAPFSIRGPSKIAFLARSYSPRMSLASSEGHIIRPGLKST